MGDAKQKVVSPDTVWNTQKKYEDHAYVLDFDPRGMSRIIKRKEGPLVQAVGENRFAFLELLVVADRKFVIGERLPVGKKNRANLVVSVLGKLDVSQLTRAARINLAPVARSLVAANRKRFEQMLDEDYFPRHKLGIEREDPFHARKLEKRLVKELLGQSPRREILLSKNGWFYPRRVVGWAAAYAKALGGGPVGDPRYLGGTATRTTRSEKHVVRK